MGNLFSANLPKRSREEDKEVISLRKRLADIEKIVKEKDLVIYNGSVKKLFDSGIPHVEFNKISHQQDSSTTYTSRHEPAILVEKDFKILDDLSCPDDPPKSIILANLISSTYNYASEPDIGHLVKSVLVDVIRLVNINGIEIVGEIGVTHVSNLRKPDFMILETQQRPIGTSEVKPPKLDHLSNANVLGQGYNYLLMMKSFYGQNEFLQYLALWMNGGYVGCLNVTLGLKVQQCAIDLKTRE